MVLDLFGLFLFYHSGLLILCLSVGAFTAYLIFKLTWYVLSSLKPQMHHTKETTQKSKPMARPSPALDGRVFMAFIALVLVLSILWYSGVEFVEDVSIEFAGMSFDLSVIAYAILGILVLLAIASLFINYSNRKFGKPETTLFEQQISLIP